MVNALGLVHGACAAIVACIAIGIYQTKPQPTRIEQRLAHLPLWVQAAILSLLVVLFASEMEWVSGDLTLPAYFIDTIGLIIHEAGHFFTSWAGPFVHYMGGTLFELGIPAGLAIWFILSGHNRLGAMALSWLLIALMSVSRYAADAQLLEADLLGASDRFEDKIAGHDWYNMLSMLNVLDAAPLIADVFWSIGTGVGIIAIGLFAWAMLSDHLAKRVFDQKLS